MVFRTFHARAVAPLASTTVLFGWHQKLKPIGCVGDGDAINAAQAVPPPKPWPEWAPPRFAKVPGVSMHVMECGDGKGACLVCGHARCACPWRVKDFVRKAYDNASKLKDGLYDDELTGQKLPWYRAVLREEKGNERLWRTVTIS